MNENILNNSAFDCLDSNIKKAFINLSWNIKNKPFDEKIAMIIAFVQSMPKGMVLTNDEKRGMINALMNEMNENEKKQMKKLLSIIGL